MSAFLWVFGVGFVSMHVGWYVMQKHYVPDNERQYHPFVKLYHRYMKSKSIED